MQRQQIHLYLIVFGIALTLSACFTEPNYSTTPAIEFEGISLYHLEAAKGVGQSKRDSIVITVNFKDGDGNLGDTPSRADSIRYATNGGWGNYEIKTFRLINKQYVEYKQDILQTLFFPDLAKNKPKGPIEGPLEFSQTYTYGSFYRMYPTKFRIRIRDRDLNTSNTIETDTLSLPFLN